LTIDDAVSEFRNRAIERQNSEISAPTMLQSVMSGQMSQEQYSFMLG